VVLPLRCRGYVSSRASVYGVLFAMARFAARADGDRGLGVGQLYPKMNAWMLLEKFFFCYKNWYSPHRLRCPRPHPPGLPPRNLFTGTPRHQRRPPPARRGRGRR
jgi:hypothetical protein